MARVVVHQSIALHNLFLSGCCCTLVRLRLLYSIRQHDVIRSSYVLDLVDLNSDHTPHLDWRIWSALFDITLWLHRCLNGTWSGGCLRVGSSENNDDDGKKGDREYATEETLVGQVADSRCIVLFVGSLCVDALGLLCVESPVNLVRGANGLLTASRWCFGTNQLNDVRFACIFEGPPHLMIRWKKKKFRVISTCFFFSFFRRFLPFCRHHQIFYQLGKFTEDKEETTTNVWEVDNIG